jgi:hypothetical protein
MVTTRPSALSPRAISMALDVSSPTNASQRASLPHEPPMPSQVPLLDQRLL